MIYNGFLINRDADICRLSRIKPRLNRHKIDFVRVPAIVSKANPEFALKMSAIRCLQMASERKLTHATIIEDDCVFQRWGLFEPAFNSLPKDWDLFYAYRWAWRESASDDAAASVVPIENNICSHFVMFNGKFFDEAIRIINHSPWALDRVFDPYSHIKKYATDINLAGQDAGTSTIDRYPKSVRFCGEPGCY